MLRNLSERGGTGKSRNYWEPVVYRILQVADDIPVFTIVPLDRSSKPRKVHRNLIMKVDFEIQDSYSNNKNNTNPTMHSPHNTTQAFKGRL